MEDFDFFFVFWFWLYKRFEGFFQNIMALYSMVAWIIILECTLIGQPSHKVIQTLLKYFYSENSKLRLGDMPLQIVSQIENIWTILM